MISIRINSPDDYRVESPEEIEAVLAPMRIFMRAIRSNGSGDQSVTVDVQKPETGREGFSRVYPNFDEMADNLSADFLAAQEASAGIYFDHISAGFTKRLRPNGLLSRLDYTGGEIVIENCEDEDTIYEACCEKIQPYLYYKL